MPKTEAQKERTRQTQKKWRERNPEKKKELDKKWREQSKEKYNEYQRNYKRKQREKKLIANIMVKELSKMTNLKTVTRPDLVNLLNPMI